MGKNADQRRHEARRALSQSILQNAREEANKKENYDSVRTRADLCKMFSERESRFKPHDWQLDVAEALILGIDCVVIAGTGSGKTIPFMLPLLCNESRKKIMLNRGNERHERGKIKK